MAGSSVRPTAVLVALIASVCACCDARADFASARSSSNPRPRPARLHPRQRRHRAVLHGRADGRRRRALRLRQRRRPRRVSRSGRAARRRRRPRSAGPSSRLFRNDLTVGPDGKRTLHFTDVTEQRRPRRCARTAWAPPSATTTTTATSISSSRRSAPDTLFQNNGNGTFTDVTARGRRQRSAVEHQRRVRRLRPRRQPRPVRRQLPRLHARRRTRSATTPSARATTAVRARTGPSPTACITTTARPLHGRDRSRRASARPTAPGSAWPRATTTVTAGSISTWPTTRRRTSCGSTGTTARSSMKGLLSGAALNAAGNPEGSMGIASGDFDRDGDEDLFVTNIVGETFALYVNDGHGNFEDARARAGLAAPTAAFTGFGTDWFDYDNDGWPDLFVANGAVNVIEAQRGQPLPFRMTQSAVSQRRAGASRRSSARRRSGVRARRDRPRRRVRRHRQRRRRRHRRHEQRRARQAAAQPVGARSNHWLRDQRSPGSRRTASRSARGSVSSSTGATPATLWRRVRTDGSYLSASDARVHFGLGASSSIAAVVVQWPDGQRERWTGVAVDRVVTLARGTGSPATAR